MKAEAREEVTIWRISIWSVIACLVQKKKKETRILGVRKLIKKQHCKGRIQQRFKQCRRATDNRDTTCCCLSLTQSASEQQGVTETKSIIWTKHRVFSNNIVERLYQLVGRVDGNVVKDIIHKTALYISVTSFLFQSGNLPVMHSCNHI